MSRIKIVFFWLFVLLATALATLAYFELKKSKKPGKEALSLVPDGCLVYFRSNAFFDLDRKVNSQSLIADKLQLFPDIQWLCSQLHRFDSLFGASEMIREQISDNPVHFSLYEGNNWLIAFNIKELGQQPRIVKELQRLLGSKPAGTDHEFALDPRLKAFFSVQDGIVIFSNSETILARCREKEKKFYLSWAYRDLASTLTEAGLLSVFMDHRAISHSDLGQKIMLNDPIAQGYSAGSLDLSPSELKINGLLLPDTSDLPFLIREQSPTETALLGERLPKTTSFFRSISANRLGSFLSPDDTSATRFWRRAEKKALFNVQRQFYESISGHVCEFQAYDRRFLSTEVADPLKAGESLHFMSDSIVEQDSLTYFIFRDARPGLLPFFDQASASCAAIYGNEMYFSQDVFGLSILLRNLSNGQLLAHNDKYRNYASQHLFEKYNYVMYCSPSVNRSVTEQFLHLDHPQDADPFENFRHFSYSLLVDNDQYKFRTHLLYETEHAQKNLLWTFALDTVCRSTPYVFVNHYSQENEIILQDEQNALYLLNAKGEKLWKIPLDERIMSEIYLVDALKNGKYQMLFNTRSALHLIDRNGNYLENFPMKLPAEASAPMSLFDYEQNRDYRIIQPCSNQSIFNFNVAGKKHEGFSAVKTENPVNMPVQFVQVGEAQFLVAIDAEGKVYVFSRRGQPRLNLRNRSVAGCGSFFIDGGGSFANTYLVYLDDKSALLNKISLNDVKTIARLNGDLDQSQLIFAPVDENRSTDVLITKGAEIRAYDFSGNLLMEKFANHVLSESGFYSDESHALIVSFSEEDGSVTVFDLINGTRNELNASAQPLLLKLFRDDKKYLIVPEGNKLHCILVD